MDEMEKKGAPAPDPKAAKDKGLTTASIAGESGEAKHDPEARPSENRSFAPEKPMTADLAPKKADVATPSAMAEEAHTPLFATNESGDLRRRWDGIQAAFVDEPRKAVEDADSLVATAMKRLAEMFADERAKLEGQWDRGDKVSTEDLRQALRRYRSFFGRLLEV